MPKVTLITGGVKSGKSSHALELAGRYKGKKVFIATAEASDRRMKKRISRHKAERGRAYVTIEEPLSLSLAVEKIRRAKPEVIVVDCLTLWVNNLLHYREGKNLDLARETQKFLGAVQKSSCDMIIITNEVGLGIYPVNFLAAEFMETLGGLNKALAKLADEVIVMISGCPLKIKTLKTKFEILNNGPKLKSF